MKFWDSSAIVPTFLEEPSSSTMRQITRQDPEIAVWWVTPVECLAAIARRERSDSLAHDDAHRALGALLDLAEAWTEVPPTESLRDNARRLVRMHDLRTADAFQLAAASALSGSQPETLPLVTLDERLAAAARREGFPVLP